MTTPDFETPPPVQLENLPAHRFQVSKPAALFSASGRLGRLRYLAYNLVGYLTLLICLAGFAFLGGPVGLIRVALVLMAVALAAYLVFAGLLTIRRSHDMGWTGWTSLFAIIPLVGLIWLLKAGNSGANRFGLPPPANTLAIKILVGVMLLGALLAGALDGIALAAWTR